MSAKYTINVLIDPAQVEILRKGGFKLCLAKDTNHDVDVIWQAAEPVIKTTFQWTAEYQVFRASSFTPGALVSAMSNSVQIESGQTAALDKFGVMRPATGIPDNSGVFFVRNEYGSMFIGIGAAHDGQWSSSYVTRTQSIGESETALTPVETVFLWFYPLVTAGTMFEHTLNGSLRLDLGHDQHTIDLVYTASGTWVILPSEQHRDASKGAEIGREAALVAA